MKKWFYFHDGAEHGPCTDREIILKIKAEELSANVLIRREDSDDFLPASMVMRKGKSGAAATGPISSGPIDPPKGPGPIKVTPKSPSKPAAASAPVPSGQPAPKAYSKPTAPIDIEFHPPANKTGPIRGADSGAAGLPTGFRPRAGKPDASPDTPTGAGNGRSRARFNRRTLIAGCLLVVCAVAAGILWGVVLPNRRMAESAAAKEKEEAEARRLADEARARERADQLAKKEAEQKAAAAAKPRRVEQLSELGTSWTNTLGMKFVPIVGTKVLFCAHETRVMDFAKFIESTRRDWIRPQFDQGPAHPVVNVMWDEAMAFARWLTARERVSGQLGPHDEYRLPSDLGWSAAAGILKEPGSTPSERNKRTRRLYPWGTNWPPAEASGNFAQGLGLDGFEFTAPVMSFPPNEFGIHDLAGNAAEWCLDWMDNYQTARAVRGGSYADVASDNLLSSFRGNKIPVRRTPEIGFRLVIYVAEEQPAPSP